MVKRYNFALSAIVKVTAGRGLEANFDGRKRPLRRSYQWTQSLGADVLNVGSVISREVGDVQLHIVWH